MVLRITKWLPVPSEPTLVTSGGPKRREKASWPSSVTCWPRKTRTECCSNAARAAARDVAKHHTAQVGGEAWTQRDDVHRQVLPGFIVWPVCYRPMFGLILR